MSYVMSCPQAAKSALSGARTDGAETKTSVVTSLDAIDAIDANVSDGQGKSIASSQE